MKQNLSINTITVYKDVIYLRLSKPMINSINIINSVSPNEIKG